MHILVIIGTRPQYIKWWPVERVLADRGIAFTVVNTGQHFDYNMTKLLFKQLRLQPFDYDLKVHSMPPAHMAAAMAARLAPIIDKERPNIAVVIGDTMSTLAGALAAARAGIPLAHIEAGVRCSNINPEETNRVVVDHLSSMLFCPTLDAMRCAEKEGLGHSAYLTGDLNNDCTMIVSRENLAQRPEGLENLRGDFDVMTLHRAENTHSARALESVFNYVNETSGARHILLPVHPRIREMLSQCRDDAIGRVKPMPPVGFLEMHWLLEHCSAVFTDSGGVQKEAFFHGKPCTLILDDTPYPELLASGWARLWKGEGFNLRRQDDSFGDGHAAARIVDLLLSERP